MQHFRAFQINQKNGKHHAGFEMLRLDQLTAGSVLIKAVYSGINYKDALAGTGQGAILRKFPLVGGIDVAGVVEQSQAAEFSVGDSVFVCGCGLSETMDGGYADYVRVPSECVQLLPPDLSLFDVMAIGSAGFSAGLAVDAMQRNAQEPEHGPVVVTGATGGVGCYSIDLFSRLGYRVVAITGKPEFGDYLESLGASEVLTRQDLEPGKRPLEAARWGGAVDSVGGEMLAWLTRTLKPGGNIASIGLAGGAHLNTTVMPFILRGINLLGINSTYCSSKQRTKIWGRLASDLRPQKIKEITRNVISLEQIEDYFQNYMDGRIIGRTVVKIA